MHKEVGKAISNTVVERLKTPLIATFIFSWIVVNHSVVLQFTFETLPNKVDLAKNLKIDWWFGLVLPALVSLGYILIIPALQLGLDWVVLKTLGEFRKKHDASVARNALESTQEHQKVLRDRELDNWDKEKQELTSKIHELTRQKGTLDTKLAHEEDEKEEVVKDKKRLLEAISEAIEKLEAIPDIDNSDKADVSNDLKTCRDVLRNLRLAKVIEEEGIPF